MNASSMCLTDPAPVMNPLKYQVKVSVKNEQMYIVKVEDCPCLCTRIQCLLFTGFGDEDLDN